MSKNIVSATLSATEMESIMSSINTIEKALPFLIDLTNNERRGLPKLGDKSRAFVNKALELATQNPGFLPRDFDIAEMEKDVKLFEALYSIRLALNKLNEQVNDTFMGVGSEAYVAALLVYNYARSNGFGTEGLDSAVDELAQRFARKAKAITPPKEDNRQA
jgi:hypothetical protein